MTTIDMTNQHNARYVRLAALKSTLRYAKVGLKVRGVSPLRAAADLGYTGKRSIDNALGWVTHEMDQMLAARERGEA